MHYSFILIILLSDMTKL